MDEVQCIVKVSNSLARRPNHSEKAEIIYLKHPNNSSDELDKVSRNACTG
jgi:hypothetical protein